MVLTNRPPPFDFDFPATPPDSSQPPAVIAIDEVVQVNTLPNQLPIPPSAVRTGVQSALADAAGSGGGGSGDGGSGEGNQESGDSPNNGSSTAMNNSSAENGKRSEVNDSSGIVPVDPNAPAGLKPSLTVQKSMERAAESSKRLSELFNQ